VNGWKAKNVSIGLKSPWTQDTGTLQDRGQWPGRRYNDYPLERDKGIGY